MLDVLSLGASPSFRIWRPWTADIPTSIDSQLSHVVPNTVKARTVQPGSAHANQWSEENMLPMHSQPRAALLSTGLNVPKAADQIQAMVPSPV